MRHQVARLVEVLATCLLGVMAGFFFAFAIDVAPAMTNLDASSYVTTQQWINRVVRNATFGATYFGSAAANGKSADPKYVAPNVALRTTRLIHCWVVT